MRRIASADFYMFAISDARGADRSVERGDQVGGGQHPAQRLDLQLGRTQDGATEAAALRDVDGLDGCRRQVRPYAQPIEDLPRAVGQRQHARVAAHGGALAGFENFRFDSVEFQCQGQRHTRRAAAYDGDRAVAIVGGGAAN
jgi:hypothetical protein